MAAWPASRNEMTGISSRACGSGPQWMVHSPFGPRWKAAGNWPVSRLSDGHSQRPATTSRSVSPRLKKVADGPSAISARTTCPGVSGSLRVHAGTGSKGLDSRSSRARSEAFSQPVVTRSLPNPYDPSKGT
jgi:hypothetical protein